MAYGDTDDLDDVANYLSLAAILVSTLSILLSYLFMAASQASLPRSSTSFTAS